MKRNNPFFLSLAGSSLVLITLSFFNKIVGFLREIIYASEFGVSKEFDIFLVVSVVPVTINTIIYYIAQNHFIPNYADNSKTRSEAEQFLFNNYLGFGIIGLFISLILFFFTDAILFFLLSIDSLDKTSRITFNIFLVTIPLSSICSILAAYLNYLRKFFVPALAAIIQNIIVVLIVVIANHFISIISIAIGYLLGTILQFFYFQYKVKVFPNILILKNFSLQTWLKKSSNSLLIIIIIEFFSQLFIITDRFFYPYIEDGGLSALNYAQNIALLPITIISLSVSTILFSKVSNNLNSIFSENDFLFMNSIRLSIFLFIPIFIIFTFWSQEVISIVYERGKFAHSDSLASARLLIYFSFGMLFYSLYAILNKILYSARFYKFLLIITFVGIITKILFNYILVAYFNYNGLAISTSVSYFTFFILGYFMLKSILGLRWLIRTFKETFVLMFNAILSYLIIEDFFYIILNIKIFFIAKVFLFLLLFVFNHTLLNPNVVKNIVYYFKTPTTIK